MPPAEWIQGSGGGVAGKTNPEQAFKHLAISNWQLAQLKPDSSSSLLVTILPRSALAEPFAIC
jgi:hypothetical protein